MTYSQSLTRLPEEIILRIFEYFESPDISDLVVWSNRLERRPYKINEASLTESLEHGQGPPPLGLQVDEDKHLTNISALRNLALVSRQISRIADQVLYRSFLGHLRNDLDSFVHAILLRPERALHLRKLVVDQFPLAQSICGCDTDREYIEIYSTPKFRHPLSADGIVDAHAHRNPIRNCYDFSSLIAQKTDEALAPILPQEQKQAYSKYLQNGVRLADCESLYALLLLMCTRLQSVSFCYTSTDKLLRSTIGPALNIRLPTIKDVHIDLQNWAGNDGIHAEARRNPPRTHGIPDFPRGLDSSQLTSLTISTGPRAHGVSLDSDFRKNFVHDLPTLRRFRCIGLTFLERDWKIMLPRMPNLEELELDLAVDPHQGLGYFDGLSNLLSISTPKLRVLKIDHRGNDTWRQAFSAGRIDQPIGRFQHLGSLKNLLNLEEVVVSHNALFDDQAASSRSELISRLPQGLKRLVILRERGYVLGWDDDAADLLTLLDKHQALEEVGIEGTGPIPDTLRHPAWTRAVAIAAHPCDANEFGCHATCSDGGDRCPRVWALLRRPCLDGLDMCLLSIGKNRLAQLNRSYDSWQSWWRGGPKSWIDDTETWHHQPREWP